MPPPCGVCLPCKKPIPSADMTQCLGCGLESSTIKKFCSRGCASRFNIKLKPKRTPEGRCHDCSKPIRSGCKRCPSCHTKFRNPTGKTRTTICATCGKDKPSNRAYCSKECVIRHRCPKLYESYIERWKLGLIAGGRSYGNVSGHIRRYIFEKFGSKCCECGWCKINPVTKKAPLHVDHINGDWGDNREDNLRLLCPNCHSLTETYGSLNRGKGRPHAWKKVEESNPELTSATISNGAPAQQSLPSKRADRGGVEPLPLPGPPVFEAGVPPPGRHDPCFTR
jgi:hypothetical protein